MYEVYSLAFRGLGTLFYIMYIGYSRHLMQLILLCDGKESHDRLDSSTIILETTYICVYVTLSP